MIKKITFLIVFVSLCILGVDAQVVNDFEAGSPTITFAGPGGSAADFTIVDNPNVKGNPLSKVARFVRPTQNGGHWWYLIKFPLATSITVPAGTTKYLHVMANYPANADVSVRFNAAVSGGVPNNGSGSGLGGDTRSSNSLSDFDQWQDLVFPITADAGAAFTVNAIVVIYDAGFQNGPAASGNFVLNNTTAIGYIDNLEFTDSATPRSLNNFTGVTSNDWNDDTNWNIGIPTATRNSNIPAGATVNIAGTTGAVVNNLTIDVAGSLTINSGGSLISGGTVTGNINYNRTLSADADATKAWHLLSSPLTGQTVENFINNNTLASGTTNTSFRGIASYMNNGSAWNYYLNTYNGTDAFNAGKGYSVKNAAAGNVSFTGTYTSGDKDFNISQATNNFNLVGNPYASYINLGTFFTDNNAANRLSEATIWLWNPNKDGVGLGGYVSKMSGVDAAFQIAPGQAFFVSSGTASSNKVTFTDANQSHQTDTFLKNAKTEISLQISQNDLKQSTKIYYIDGATTDFDNGFDGSMFTGVYYDLAIYSQLITNNNDRKIGVQSLPNSNIESMVIPIGVASKINKKFTISASALNLQNSINIYLEDKKKKIFINLKETDYTTVLDNNLEEVGRFFIHTTSSVLSLANNKLVGVDVYKKNNTTLAILGLDKGKLSASLFNLLGEKVMSSKFYSSQTNFDLRLPKLATGVYIFKLTTEKGDLHKKIILD